MRLAQDFWDTYPTDSRRDTARAIFIAANPYFISRYIPDSLEQILTSIPRKEWSRFMKTLPLEETAMQQWLQKGSAMVAEVLESDRPLEDKEAAEWSLFGRDFRRAARYFGLLQPKATEATEIDYWNVVDAQYWASFELRLGAHIEKYANLPILADRAKDFLSSLKAHAPKVAGNCWQELYQKCANSQREGEKELCKTAKEQLEALGVASGKKELEMKFTALDGRKIDLKNMRGKVVLVDFWATWCAPCVKEVPHLKELYKKYHDQGFEIIGITLDEGAAAERVKELIAEKEIPWPQRFEGKGFNNDSYRQLYGIGSLPTVWLVNKEGIIVDRNARGERLEPLIQKYLGLSKK
jgi:thiol-disulfide isomerase/thioredoxin